MNIKELNKKNLPINKLVAELGDTCLILAFGRWRQEDQAFKVGLGCISSDKTLFQINKKILVVHGGTCPLILALR